MEIVVATPGHIDAMTAITDAAVAVRVPVPRHLGG